MLGPVPAVPRGKRRAVILLSLLIAGVILALGAGELIARTLYRAPWYERLLTEQRYSEDYPYERNADGLRDRDYPSPKPPGRRRVLVLGDSFTFGQGVFDDGAVFPSLIEDQLARSTPLPGVGAIDVLNGGVGGSLTGDWLVLWNRIAPRFDPDVVLIVFFLRDGTRSGSIPDFFGKIRNRIVSSNSRSRLYRHSYLYRTLRDALDRQWISVAYLRAFENAYFGDHDQTSEWRAARRNLMELSESAARRGATVGFVIFPVLVELSEEYPFQAIVDRLEQFAIAADLPVHSLLPDFLGEDAAQLWVSDADQHPNERAHAIAAESLLPFVSQLLVTNEDAHR